MFPSRKRLCASDSSAPAKKRRVLVDPGKLQDQTLKKEDGKETGKERGKRTKAKPIWAMKGPAVEIIGKKEQDRGKRGMERKERKKKRDALTPGRTRSRDGEALSKDVNVDGAKEKKDHHEFCNCTGIYAPRSPDSPARPSDSTVCTAPLKFSRRKVSRWVDVLVGPEEQEFRLPVAPLIVHCTWFAERLRDSGDVQGDQHDSLAPEHENEVEYRAYDGKTMGGVDSSMVPRLRLPDLDADMFSVVMRGILTYPQYQLRRSDSDNEDEDEWSFEDLTAAYLTADALDCVLMRDSIVDLLIPAHQAYAKCNGGLRPCTPNGACTDREFCQDLGKMIFVLEFLDNVQSAEAQGCLTYFRDCFRFNRRSILEVYRNDTHGAVSWQKSRAWNDFLSALLVAVDDPGTIERLDEFDLDDDLCQYHDHGRYGFEDESYRDSSLGQCPSLTKVRQQHEADVRSAIQPLLTNLTGCDEEVKRMLEDKRTKRRSRNEDKALDVLRDHMNQLEKGLACIADFVQVRNPFEERHSEMADVGFDPGMKKWSKELAKCICDGLVDVSVAKIPVLKRDEQRKKGDKRPRES